ncbi:hypothetical protein [Lysobacter sp.]|uniref:hypothetical protein n=1 Tax=Lysobacter sp. TaxID=72226 RepID=UPI002D5E39C9|nr:hypothetical protein [Lysobacter sp.]HZX77743.1 hypothetical protein [Lysobacter sp.]
MPDPVRNRRTGVLVLVLSLLVGLPLAGYAGLAGYFYAACPPGDDRLGWTLAVYLGAPLYWWWLVPLVLTASIALAAVASSWLSRFSVCNIAAGMVGAAAMVFLAAFLLTVLAGVHERCGFP